MSHRAPKQPLQSVGILVPNTFNSVHYDAINAIAASKRDSHDREWRSFAAAWNAIPYRLLAALEADATFTRSIAVSAAPPPDERFLQEDALFRFFASASSSLESFYFASYCIGAIVDQAAFPMALPADLKKYPREVYMAFTARFPRDRLTLTLDRNLSSSEFKMLVAYRNFLSHRGCPLRKTVLGGETTGTFIPTNPQALSDAWAYDLRVTASTTSNPRAWLEPTLATCIEELHSFSQARL